MDCKATVSLLLLLLGISNAHHGNVRNNSLNILQNKCMLSFILIGSSNFMLEGDILMPRSRTAMKCLNEKYSCLWPKSPNGIVEIPFLINDSERSLILTSMKDFETKTCIRFIPRWSQYLQVKPNIWDLFRGCHCRGLAAYKKASSSIELLHALGFYHEHTRQLIYFLVYFAYNFDKKDTDNLNTPYDYSSVMHYGKTAFGINGLETITPIPDPSAPIGQRNGLSDIDILRINRLYQSGGISQRCTEGSVPILRMTSRDISKTCHIIFDCFCFICCLSDSLSLGLHFTVCY
uniref:Metalloendopeptidase n=1 Tax=Lates calcarifer TaxID=8187 RepID=A0A4W6F5C4_LATCA